MKPVQKPEWIALADCDKLKTPRHISRGLPILAIAITAAIIGAGSIFAQPQELSVANADPVSVATTQNSSQVESSDSDVSGDVSDTTRLAADQDMASLPTKSQSDDGADDESMDDNGVSDNNSDDEGTDDNGADDEGIDD